jgi:anti-anti-sigma factor
MNHTGRYDGRQFCYMKFKEVSPGVGVVSLEGEYDLSDVEKALNEFSKLEELHVAIVDLSQAQYMDSTILGILVQLYKRARNLNRPVLFVQPGHGLSRIFSIVGLDKILPLFGTLDEALQEAKKL